MGSRSQSKVCFFYDGVRVSLSNRTGLKKFIGSLLKREGKKLGSLNYIFVSDKRLLQINRDYLGHDYYTDIITFDLSDHPSKLQAEIYISVDRVRENARDHHVTFISELHRVIFHGALHLAGYGDKLNSEIQLMRQKEEHYLKQYL